MSVRSSIRTLLGGGRAWMTANAKTDWSEWDFDAVVCVRSVRLVVLVETGCADAGSQSGAPH
jgi:hypothetical protein